MARKKHNELAAGIFVILALVVLVGVVIWLGGSGILRPARQKAVFYVNERAGSLGLATGGFVKIGDDQVGKIANIRFDPAGARTLYVVEIERDDFTVHADGKARVAAGLVGGAELVILSRGTEDKPLADEANPIEIAGGLDQTMSDLSSAVSKLNEVIQAELQAGNEGAILFKVHEVLDSLRSATASVADIATRIRAETDKESDEALLRKIHLTMDNLKDMTDDAKPKVGDALTDVREVTRKMRQYTEKDVADVLAKLREANTNILKITTDFSTVSGQAKQLVMMHRDNIDEMIDNMVHVSTNLKAASKEIRRNPWRLLYKPEEKEIDSANIRAAARSFAEGAAQLDQALAKMTGLAKAQPEGIASDDPTLQKIREQLEQTFENFSKAEAALWKELDKYK